MTQKKKLKETTNRQRQNRQTCKRQSERPTEAQKYTETQQTNNKKKYKLTQPTKPKKQTNRIYDAPCPPTAPKKNIETQGNKHGTTK